MTPVLWIVSPCYNESETLPHSVPIMLQKLAELCKAGCIDEKSRILLVDDGSGDNTWQIISDFCQKEESVCGVRLQKNAGENKACLTGLTVAENYADVIISIDCDLQDDINLWDAMLKCYAEGNDIVYGYRDNRDTDTPLHRFCSAGFYKAMTILGSDMVPQASQYRLMSREAVAELSKIPAKRPFLPAMVPEIKMKSAKLPYRRETRVAGDSAYSYRKLIKLALSVITEYTPAVDWFCQFVAADLLVATCAILADNRRNGKQKEISDTRKLLPVFLCNTGSLLSHIGNMAEKKRSARKPCELPAIDWQIIQ